ncbi:unnamed protein product [Rhizoctonia solani]|uniref:Uncharacterized protein n=1 Tax=Rhizoctonia solani TaxID=456999 RepID=A0A8H2XCC3_9AGAM|nr:unnamed protein product [Rhizoctonia solani]
MAINTAHIVSHYAQPKPRGFQWSPRPLKLAKTYPPPPRTRTSAAQPSPPDAPQPVVRVQNEQQEETSLVEKNTVGVSESQPSSEGQLETTSSIDSTSPLSTNPELIVAEQLGMSPEDFLRNALPSTHTFTQPTPTASPSHSRLEISPHRLRPSSSMSNISSGSNRSRPPSAMSIGGQTRRSSSRTSVRLGTASSLGATSS